MAPNTPRSYVTSQEMSLHSSTNYARCWGCPWGKEVSWRPRRLASTGGERREGGWMRRIRFAFVPAVLLRWMEITRGRSRDGWRDSDSNGCWYSTSHGLIMTWTTQDIIRFKRCDQITPWIRTYQISCRSILPIRDFQHYLSHRTWHNDIN